MSRAGNAASPTPVVAEDLVKRFKSVTALDGAGIRVDDGEVVALMGPNGSGKSTILRIIAGTLTPDAGSVTIVGSDMLKDRRRAVANIGFSVAAESAWYGRLSGRANLDAFAALAGLASNDARPVVDALLEDYRLAQHADRAVAEYSRGMRARLAIARARLGNPTVLLLDEPTTNLDVESAASLVAGLGCDGGVRAIIFTTHAPAEAAAAADRVVVLRAGRVAAELTRPIREPELTSVLVESA